MPKSSEIATSLLKSYMIKLRHALDSVAVSEIQEILNVLLELRTRKATLYVAGNGGSASTSQHLCVDLGVGGISRNSVIRSLSLSDNQSAITALANDRNFQSVYSAQLSIMGKSGDVLLVISASGNSDNLIAAVKEARAIGLTTIGLLGFDGGKLRSLCDFSILVKTEIGEYGIVEDVHLSICHNLTEALRSIT